MEQVILETIREWSEEGYWCGYPGLISEIQHATGEKIEEKELKRVLKKMRKDGLLVVRPIFSERTGLLNGSAYFTHE